jgi:parvulin-like peptidyl-prolyl isomerase
MKRFFMPFLFLVLLWSGCSKSVKLKKDTPAYRFAKELAAKLPYVDPDKNNVLISTKQFKITTGEVMEEIHTAAGNRADQFKTMPPEQVKYYVEQTAMNLSEKKILLFQASKMKIEATSAQVDSVVSEYIKEAGSKENFERKLGALGIGLDLIKRDVKTQLTVDRLLTKHFEKDMLVSEEEIQKTHERGNIATVRHILMMTQGKNDSSKRVTTQKMTAIQERIKKGEDFAALANRYSEDPGSNRKGGLVANFKRGDMVPAFDDMAFSLPVGSVSDIFETDYGYHILKVIDRKKDSKPMGAAERADIQKQLQQRKRNELIPKIQVYMDQLKQECALSVSKF